MLISCSAWRRPALTSSRPNVERQSANGIMVTVAEEERRMISNRTKDALAAAKTHGKKPLIERRGP